MAASLSPQVPKSPSAWGPVFQSAWVWGFGPDQVVGPGLQGRGGGSAQRQIMCGAEVKEIKPGRYGPSLKVQFEEGCSLPQNPLVDGVVTRKTGVMYMKVLSNS